LGVRFLRKGQTMKKGKWILALCVSCMALVSLTCFFRHAHAEKEETEPPKTKYYSGEAIEGAVLQLIDKDGKIVKEWTTTKAAYEIGAELVAGETYILHEKSAPPGYLLAEDISFTVPLDGKKQEITMVDAPTSVEIEKKDKDRGEYVLLKTFCRSARTRMPLFTDWGITLEGKYHISERPIRDIEYMDVKELIDRLKKKTGRNIQSEVEKEDNTAKIKDSPTEIDSNNTFGA